MPKKHQKGYIYNRGGVLVYVPFL